MEGMSVTQFAGELKMPSAALLEQLKRAGVDKSDERDMLTEQDKSRLLEYLRESHGSTGKSKITLTRKQTSEIRTTDATGRARAVQVEVRKKRVFVKVAETATNEEAVLAAPEVIAPPAPELEPMPAPATAAVEPVVAPVTEATPVETPPEPESEPVSAETPAVLETVEAVTATETEAGSETAETAAPAAEVPQEPSSAAKTAAKPASTDKAAATGKSGGRSRRVSATPPPVAQILSAEELASRELESRRSRELRERQQADLRARQERESAAKAAAENRRQEEASRLRAAQQP
ncbi:MAG: translation initiation factor IF-2 associated domain-containing protein, partial [Azoarcus sp.]|nr:translation initiation factor IF-2 associated domain-containing protein [Azoarcus sp.]